MEKKNFSEIEIEVISFDKADIIRMSDNGGVDDGWFDGDII